MQCVTCVEGVLKLIKPEPVVNCQGEIGVSPPFRSRTRSSIPPCAGPPETIARCPAAGRPASPDNAGVRSSSTGYPVLDFWNRPRLSKHMLNAWRLAPALAGFPSSACQTSAAETGGGESHSDNRSTHLGTARDFGDNSSLTTTTAGYPTTPEQNRKHKAGGRRGREESHHQFPAACLWGTPRAFPNIRLHLPRPRSPESPNRPK